MPLRNGWFHGVIGILFCLLLATAPYYLTGRASLALLDRQLQILNDQPGIPLGIKLENYQGGVYQSRVSLLVESHRQSFSAFFIDIHVSHGFCGVELKAHVLDQAGRSVLETDHREQGIPPLLLNVDCLLPALWSQPLQARFDVPKLVFETQQMPLLLDATTLQMSLREQINTAVINATLPELHITQAGQERLRLKNVQLEIVSAKSADLALDLSLQLEQLNLSSPSFQITGRDVRSSVRLEQDVETISGRWHWQLTDAVVDGVPYVRINELELIGEFSSLAQSYNQPVMSVEQRLSFVSNYGPVTFALSSLEKQSPADQHIQFQARLPGVIMELLSKSALRDFLASGELRKEGVLVSWKGEYSLAELLAQ